MKKKIYLLSIVYEIDTKYMVSNIKKILLTKSISVKTLVFSMVSFHLVEPLMNVYTYREKNTSFSHPLFICRICIVPILHKLIYLHMHYSAYILIFNKHILAFYIARK